MTPAAIKVFVIAAAILLVIFDVYLSADGIAGNTYSSVLREWFKKCRWLYFAVALTLGILLAHWGPA